MSLEALPGKDAGERYMVQLDALRAIAVLGVCLQHWTHDLPTSVLRQTLDLMPLDSWRVQLFFALSGFLITMILLKARTRVELTGASRWHALRAFYARRVLRTWPLFFLVLLAMALLNLRPTREELSWTATFLTNFRIFLLGETTGVVTHFWSLAVEEQFYFVWPWLILLAPRKALVWILIGVAVVLNASQVGLAWMYDPSRTGLGYLPGANVNTLVYGSILAIYRDHPALDRVATRIGLYIALPLSIASFYLVKPETFGPFTLTIDRLAIAPLLGWVLLQTARGIKGPIGKILELRPLLWLGTISFGIYLIHNAPLTFFREYAETLGLYSIPKFRSVLANEFTRVTLLLATTVGLSALAYYCFERPINRLKRFFPYVPRLNSDSASKPKALPATLSDDGQTRTAPAPDQRRLSRGDEQAGGLRERAEQGGEASGQQDAGRATGPAVQR